MKTHIGPTDSKYKCQLQGKKTPVNKRVFKSNKFAMG